MMRAASVATTVSDPQTLLPRSKPATRQALRARRDAMSAAERSAASARIAAATHALLTSRLHAGAVVGLYSAKGSEVETAEIARAALGAGLRLAYPRVVSHDRVLEFGETSLDALVAAPFGLHEPAADAPLVPLASIAAFVIPGLGFDRRGGRIGWGRGHYDATLTKAPQALRIGVAYECQVIDHVPRDPHDVLVQYLITEVATLAVV